MWSDLNMHDRHKLIRLAVTNGVYDLDTIHSLYDDTQNTYDKGGPIGRKLIRDINERSAADFVKRLQDRNREYIVNPDNTISTHKLSWATDDQGNAIVYPEVQNTPEGLVDYSYDRNRAFEEALRNKDTLMMSPSQAEWFTTHYKKYYPSFRYDKGGNMKIAPYRDNSSYADRKLYRNVKRDFRKNPEAEYKDYDEYGVRVYNPSLPSDAPNRKERQEVMLERIRQDFPEIQKNDVKKTAFKSNTLGWHNNNTGYMGTEDKRTLYGLQQEYDFVNNIVPYGKLGMDTPENIRRKEELERKNRNTTFDYTNNFDIGGNLSTDPNRLPIDTSPIIDRIRAERLARYTAPDSALAQIKELTDNIKENEFKREFAEWINPTRNTNDYVDIRRTIPVAEARPTFINTYEKGGPKDPPYDWNKAWTDAQSVSNETKPKGHYNVVATDGKNSNYNYKKNVIPDLSWYKDPLENTRMVTEEPIEPLYGFKDPIFNVALLGAGLANGIGKGVLSTATKATMEGLSKPITTIAQHIPQLGKYSYMMPTLDKALWATTGASGLYNRVSNEGIQGITSHPFLTAMDLGMLSPIGKGIKSSVSKSMSELLDRTAEAMVRQGDALPNFKLWNKKGMLNYILRGEKHPELAYKSGPYSGEKLIDFSKKKTEYYSHPKDVVDAFFNKGYTMYPSNIDMEPHLQQYINMHYPNKNIKVYDLGNIFSKKEIRDVNNPKIIMPQTISNGINSVDVGGHNVYPIGINPYNEYVTRGWDIWKFKGSDLVKSHGYKRGKLAKMVGDFIDSRGTPLVHTWQTHYPIKTLEKPILQHIDENIFTPDEDFMSTLKYYSTTSNVKNLMDVFMKNINK